LIPNGPRYQPVEVDKRAGIRLPSSPLRPIKRRLVAPRAKKIDAANIQLLHMGNFGLYCRQQGVTMMRTTFGVLEEVIQAPPNIHLPDLQESFCMDLL
jgi:hypothetical protein